MARREDTRHFTVNFTVMMLILRFADVGGLRCYTCVNKPTNHLCVSELHLLDCPAKKYDTCQTVVAFSVVSEKVTITKSCATKSSCLAQKRGTPKTPCESSSPVWVCTSCCHHDACNFSGAESVHAPSPTTRVVMVTMASILWCFEGNGGFK